MHINSKRPSLSLFIVLGVVGFLALPTSAFAAACNFTNTNIQIQWAPSSSGSGGSGSYNYTSGPEVYRSYGDLGLDGGTSRNWSASVNVTNNGVTRSFALADCPFGSSGNQCYKQSGVQDIGGASFEFFFEVQSYVHARVECTPSSTNPSTPSASITANPTSIQSGSGSLLSWSSANVSSCSINQGVGSVAPNTSGSLSVSPSETTTYVLTCNTGSPVTGATWQYDSSDISDFSCPLTQNANAYNNVPNCPGSAGGPQGQSCNPGSNDTCKVNYANQSTCNIETTLYSCEVSGSPSSGTVSAAATVTVTQVPDLVGQVGGAATTNVNQPITLYGGVANEGVGASEYFANIIQVCDTNCATINQTLAANAVTSLAPGGWAQLSASYTPASAAPQFYRVCANNNTSWVNVHAESNYGNNCSGWQHLTVGTPSPDLTAGAITPSTASRGQTRALSATVTNAGGTAAGASTGYFQLTAPVSKQSTTASPSVPTIAPGGSAVASFSYTFQTAGTYSVRLCADWANAVAESNEGNNCGPWTYVAVSEAPVGSSVSCSVSSQAAIVGGSVTYTAYPVAAATSPYGWTGSDGATGFGSGSTAVRTFTAPGTYGMQVTATNAPAAAQCPLVTVGANWCTGASSTLEITATPSRVRAGQSSVISWNASGVNGEGATCSVTGPGVSWTSAVSAVPACSATGSETETISTQSTYTLTCAGQSKSVVVNVIPGIIEF